MATSETATVSMSSSAPPPSPVSPPISIDIGALLEAAAMDSTIPPPTDDFVTVTTISTALVPKRKRAAKKAKKEKTEDPKAEVGETKKRKKPSKADPEKPKKPRKPKDPNAPKKERKPRKPKKQKLGEEDAKIPETPPVPRETLREMYGNAPDAYVGIGVDVGFRNLGVCVIGFPKWPQGAEWPMFRVHLWHNVDLDAKNAETAVRNFVEWSEKSGLSVWAQKADRICIERQMGMGNPMMTAFSHALQMFFEMRKPAHARVEFVNHRQTEPLFAKLWALQFPYANKKQDPSLSAAQIYDNHKRNSHWLMEQVLAHNPLDIGPHWVAHDRKLTDMYEAALILFTGLWRN